MENGLRQDLAAAIANTRRAGITHAVISPRAAGDSIFGGTGLVANLSADFNSIENSEAFIYVQLGAQGTSRSGGSRAATFRQLRAALDDAGAYPARTEPRSCSKLSSLRKIMEILIL